MGSRDGVTAVLTGTVIEHDAWARGVAGARLRVDVQGRGVSELCDPKGFDIDVRAGEVVAASAMMATWQRQDGK
ncbi:hypothetical protein [Mycetocola saprophilus]|uniref:hypothetical protein n=1 Tax=Mycetocola saprophilus TaxID=76636 RepID=UPI0004C1E156|nr:hypothetical protein [Mycetocola saprophilus]